MTVVMRILQMLSFVFWKIEMAFKYLVLYRKSCVQGTSIFREHFREYLDLGDILMNGYFSSVVILN